MGVPREETGSYHGRRSHKVPTAHGSGVPNPSSPAKPSAKTHAHVFSRSSGPPARPRATKGTNGNLGRRRWFPYLLVAPSMVLFVLVIAYPFVQSLVYGLYDRSLLGSDASFVGLQNVLANLSDEAFWAIVAQTGVFVVSSTLGAFVIALALALALDSAVAAKGFWTATFLVPWILPGVVVSFLWRWIFDANYGLLNALVSLAGGPAHTNWLNSPALAMAAIVIAKVWHSFPWMTILLLASLKGVPPELHDAATVDGANRWHKQVHVILPQIKPAIGLTLLLETIWNLQQFEIPFVMTGGGPAGATETLSIDLYKTAFRRFNLGEAGAIGILWAVLMAGLVVIYVLYTRKQERRFRS